MGLGGFNSPTYWSSTFDVFGWNDVHEDDDSYGVIASFESRNDAYAFVRDDTKERKLWVRPPSHETADVIAYLNAIWTT